MNNGLYALAGCSATATAAACANRFDEPITNVSNVYFGLRRACSDAPEPCPPPPEEPEPVLGPPGAPDAPGPLPVGPGPLPPGPGPPLGPGPGPRVSLPLSSRKAPSPR